MKLLIASTLLVSSMAIARPACPNGRGGWEDYRRQMAERISSFGSQHVMKVQDFRHEVDECLEGASDKPLAERCLARVRDFLKGQDFPESKLGFSVKDEEYYEKTEVMNRMPEELGTSELLSAIRSQNDIDDFDKVVKKLNVTRKEKGLPDIEWARYYGTIQSPDAAASKGRMLVYYPDPPNKREMWLSYGLPEEGRPRSTHLFVITAVQKDEKTWEGYFRSWGRIYAHDGSVSIGETIPGTTIVACFECHKSGAPLHVTPSAKDPEQGKRLERFNQIFKKYQAMSSPYDLSPYKGPGFGPVKERPDSFYDRCAGGKVSKDSYVNLRAAMQCSKCHNGTYRGKLNPPLDYRRVVKPALERRMPPGLTDKLTKNEKDALLNCLHQEYWGPSNSKGSGLLYDYLVEQKCE